MPRRAKHPGWSAEQLHELAVATGRKGGLIRSERLSPKRRSELARAAALAGWAKRRNLL